MSELESGLRKLLSKCQRQNAEQEMQSSQLNVAGTIQTNDTIATPRVVIMFAHLFKRRIDIFKVATVSFYSERNIIAKLFD